MIYKTNTTISYCFDAYAIKILVIGKMHKINNCLVNTVFFIIILTTYDITTPVIGSSMPCGSLCSVEMGRMTMTGFAGHSREE